MGWFDRIMVAAEAMYYIWTYGSKFLEVQKEHPDWSLARCIKALFPNIPKPVAEYIVEEHWNSVKRAVTPPITEHQQKIYWEAEEYRKRDLKDLEDNWDKW
ncbi:hypothetical protein V6N13_090479 [Hibiscus sabdariffa]|uniref:Uncharacterized protein n=1 Tax=Hibiscus sabdariffa TaxID=183260 RepID=A0ABR2C0C8_9ROSI